MKFPEHAQDLWSQTWDALADIVEITNAEGHLVYVNRAFETNYGYSAEDCVGRTLSSLVRSDVHDEAFFDTMWSTLVRGETWRGRVVSKARDGRLVHQETVVTPIRDASDVVRHFVGVKRVVNAQVELERRLRRHEQLAVLGQLAASVAHEINNPLTWVIANLEFFKGEFADVSPNIPVGHLREMEQMLGDSLDGAHRIRKIVQGLKHASSPVEGAEACVFEDVHHALDEAIAIAEHQLRHRATVVRTYGDIPQVLVSPGALGQVFLNLLVNAAQSIAPGNVHGNTVHCRTACDAKYVTVEIADTGRGIASGDLHRVFEPFVTTRKSQGGTGLGLAISRSLVSKCGGTLSVRSEIGEGATFILRFPRVAEVHESPENATTPAQAQSVTGRLLVVDDEPQMCVVLRRMLRGYKVDIQTSGRAALKSALENDYDLILCDLMMPDLTGMQVFLSLKSTRPAAADRVIFLTGGVTVPEVAAFLNNHQQPVLYKPFDTEAVRQLVAERIAARNSRR